MTGAIQRPSVARGDGRGGPPTQPIPDGTPTGTDETTTAEHSVHYPRPVQARTTVRGVILLQLLANAAGAAIILVYVRRLIPLFGGTPSSTAPKLEINLLVLGVYLVLVVFVAVPINKHILTKAMRWVKEGRAPTTKERNEALGQPLFQTATAFLGWVSAAIVFGWLYDDYRRIGVGVLLAGMVTCTLLYLLLERHFRPVFALALADFELPRVRREILIRIMGAWWLGSAIPLLAIGLAPLIYPDEQYTFTIGLSLTIMACIAGGGLVMRAAAGAVSAPVNEVREAMAEVEDGNLDVKVPVTNVGEIGQLQVGFNRMVEGLRERRQLHDLFGRQVGIDVAQRALETSPALGGEEREITALFIDLDNFTAFTERHSPTEVVAKLNQFFSVVISVVMAEGGWVNKFEGDAALCIFGAPARLEDHAACALRAASRLPVELAALQDDVRAGIGVATGSVVAGNVGTAERYEYTVIGDAVNVAARLTELAKRCDPAVLVSEETIRAAQQDGNSGAAHWQVAETVTLRGRSRPITSYRPAGAHVHR